jgi:hypothetical protein
VYSVSVKCGGKDKAIYEMATIQGVIPEVKVLKEE